MDKQRLDELLAEQANNPDLLEKTDLLMSMINLIIAASCMAIEEHGDARTVVRKMPDMLMTTIAAAVGKYVTEGEHTWEDVPYGKCLLLFHTALQKEALRRGLTIPEYVVVVDEEGTP